MAAPITDRDMYAATGFTRPEDVPECLKEMDAEEQIIVEKERADIQQFPYERNGIGTFYGTVMGTLTGFTFGALTPIPAAPIIGAVGGGIAGYQAGRYTDEHCCAWVLEE